MNKTEKTEMVESLAGDLARSSNAIVFAFAGLKVPEVTELRRQVRGTQSKYLVVKNTLALRATKGTPLEAVAEHFKGATAVVYNRTSPVALAKVLTNFAKTNPNLVFKAAVIEGQAVRGLRDQDDRRAALARGARFEAALRHAVADAAPRDGLERAGPQSRGRHVPDRGPEVEIGCGRSRARQLVFKLRGEGSWR